MVHPLGDPDLKRLVCVEVGKAVGEQTYQLARPVGAVSNRTGIGTVKNSAYQTGDRRKYR